MSDPHAEHQEHLCHKQHCTHTCTHERLTVRLQYSGVHCPAGLPRLLVDVRHEASHNDMPSLSLLRLAAAQALDWLQAAYWQRQEAHLLQQQHKVIELLKASSPCNVHALPTLSETQPSALSQLCILWYVQVFCMARSGGLGAHAFCCINDTLVQPCVMAHDTTDGCID